jgi:hypothetical protein
LVEGRRASSGGTGRADRYVSAMHPFHGRSAVITRRRADRAGEGDVRTERSSGRRRSLRHVQLLGGRSGSGCPLNRVSVSLAVGCFSPRSTSGCAEPGSPVGSVERCRAVARHPEGGDDLARDLAHRGVGVLGLALARSAFEPARCCRTPLAPARPRAVAAPSSVDLVHPGHRQHLPRTFHRDRHAAPDTQRGRRPPVRTPLLRPEVGHVRAAVTAQRPQARSVSRPYGWQGHRHLAYILPERSGTSRSVTRGVSCHDVPRGSCCSC